MAAFRNCLWRWISGILGVTCLSLMATLGIVLQNAYNPPSTEPTMSPATTTDPQDDSGYSSCQEGWVGYRCNCYFISSESRSWHESRAVCVSMNSSLLQMHSRDELNFMRFSGTYYWIGGSYSAEHGAWAWEDGSAIPRDLLSLSQPIKSKTCIAYDPMGSVWTEDCTQKFYYVCKQQLI